MMPSLLYPICNAANRKAGRWQPQENNLDAISGLLPALQPLAINKST